MYPAMKQGFPRESMLKKNLPSEPKSLIIFFKGNILLFVLMIHGFAHAQPVYLPLDHWLYPFLDRLEMRGAFGMQYYRSIPMFRSEAADLIRSADEKMKHGGLALSDAEVSLLEKAKGELESELHDTGISIDPNEYERHLTYWQERNSGIYLDAYVREDAHSEKRDIRGTWRSGYHTSGGGIIRGVIENKVGFYIDFRNTLIKGEDILTESFSTSQGLPIAISGGNATTTQATAYFSYEGSWGGVMAGRGDINWGPGYHTGLALSENGLVFDQIKLHLKFKRIKFTSVHGTLHNDIDRKNIAAHRLEARITPRISIGASETVIYGRRGWELIYVNPIMPYHVAEQHAGDKDNNTMSLDMQIRYPANFRMYGELFIDDFSLGENWNTYYGNKFGMTIGGYWANPLSISNTDFRFEYTRIDPFVYTHHDPLNMYTNYNRILGSALGPNSDSIYLEGAYRLSRSLRVAAAYQNRRHGKGDVAIPHAPEDGDRKQFLKGILEQHSALQAGFEYEAIRDLFISFNYAYETVKNRDLISSFDYKNTLLDLRLSFNY